MALAADDPALLTALDSLLPGTVRRDRNSLGSRELERELDDLFAGAGLLLVGEENAVFDVLSRGTRLLEDEIATARGAAAAIYTLGRDLLSARGRRAAALATARDSASLELGPVERARDALVSLEAALAVKSGGVASASHPAYSRYRDETQRFLSGPGQEVRAGTAEIAPTLEEARATLPGLVREFVAALAALTSRGDTLSGGLASFSRANVLAKIAAPTVTAARADLDARLAALEGMTEVERRAALRDLVVGVLNARGALRGALVAPSGSVVRTLSGVATPTADTTHPATNGAIVGAVAGPHLIAAPSTQLLVTVGGAPVSLALSPSPVARVDGVSVEPFELAAAPYDNRTLELELDGVVRTLVLAAGTRSAASIAAEITAAWSTHGYAGVATGPTGAQAVSVVATTWREGSSADVPSPASPAALVLGFAAGSGVAARRSRTREVVTEIEAIVGDTVVAAEALTPLWSGTARTDPAPIGWTVLRATGTILSAAAGRFEFELDDPGGTTAHVREGDTLAFETGALAGTAWVVDIVTSSLVFEATGDASVTPAFEAGVAIRIAAPRRADPLGEVVVSLARSTASLTRTSGTTHELVRQGGDVWPATGIEQALLRDGDDREVVLVVLARSGDALTVAAPYPIPTPLTGVTVDLLPAAAATQGGNALELGSGPLAGRYDVAEVGGGDAPRSCSGEIVLVSPLAYAASSRTPSTPIAAPAVVSATHLSLAARDTSNVGGEIALAVGGASAAFTTVALSATPTTEWLALDAGVRGVVVGDRLRRTAVGGVTTEVEIVDRPLTELARVSPAVPVADVWDFSAVLEPFARAAPGPQEAFRAFAGDWFTWTETAPAAAYTAELERRAGLVASAANPLPVDYQVNDLLVWVEAAIVALDAAAVIAAAFRVAKAPGVDDLFRAFREKGARRAIDTLYRGDFEGFFALDVETVSYSGALSAAVATTARLDMPVRKVDRSDTTAQRVIGSAPTTDFEFSTADINESPNPDVPQD